MRLWVLLVPITLGAQTPLEHFESKVRPLFAAKCYACHSGKTKMAGLDLTSRASFKEVVGDGSRLLDALSYSGRAKMPPAGKLPPSEIAELRQWVEAGAPWPESKAVASGIVWKAGGKSYWAFQPVLPVQPPAVRSRDWVRKPIDQFILARLEAIGLQPAPQAARETLLRRVTFDLTGLPPTLQELDAFLADSAPDAWARVVDRLLASPQYGEKWGRHWLDVARYADSTGMDEDHMYPHAWRYRDYVVKAFNDDKPYNRFLMEQIAGDRLGEPVATGFLALGPKPLAQQDRVKMVYDVVDEQIDVTSKAMLGLTVACARCHDHKFDPILQRDYYSLAGIFASSKNFRNNGRPGAVSYINYVPLDPPAYEQYQQAKRRMHLKLMEAEDALAEEHEAINGSLRPQVEAYLLAAWNMRHNKAADPSLDASRLEKLLKVLPFDKQEKHWKPWYEATEDNIAKVAAEYGKAYRAWSTKWDERLKGWRKRYRIEVDEDRDLPARPVFDPEDDHVFADLTFKGGPFELGEGPRTAALRAEWKQLEKSMPPEPAMASALADGPAVEQHIFLRGDHHNPGAVAPKAFPIILAGEQPPAIENGSGRLELARWIAGEKNPLTARVMVNRVWQWHFGDGLMRTPNNWGSTGEKPTHPELLDYLARNFMDNGWSMKALHREILLSSAYQMDVKATSEARAKDPGNRLWSRFARRRMTVEEIRDSLLVIDGSLDAAIGGSLMSGEKGKRPNIKPDDVRRRTLYLPVRRGSIPTLLATFDYGDATTSSDGRTRTNIAPQALFMMNSAFVQARSAGFAKRLEAFPVDRARVTEAYRIALSRAPTGSEIDQALTYVAEATRRENTEEAWQSWCHVLLSTNEFIYF